MNTYDPAHYIVYVSIGNAPRAAGMSAPAPTPAPAAAAAAMAAAMAAPEHRLPRGYADASPRTRLRSRAADRSATASRRSWAS